MKVLQIIGGFCFWDASDVLRNASDAENRFSPDMIFTDAPDYVFEGWGFDESLEGDARFIQPQPPEGWLYDSASGTFYEAGGIRPSEINRSPGQIAAENIGLKKKIAALEEQLSETQLALCEVYENILTATGG